MKKSTLALSIAAAIGGLGLAGNALAVTDVSGAGTGSVIARNDNGIGHQLVFPYFTAQNGNATLLSITNTDTTNGKLVKVRFRGAANSDDLYDFQVALSPGDVWSASVTKDAATGAASLTTTDKSCTVPNSVNGVFSGLRADTLVSAAAQSLEGYVEVINMADIPNVAAPNQSTTTSALFVAIKHVSGVAPCTASVISDILGTDDTAANLRTRGLANPTTGLTGDWIILNQTSTAAWSGSATALEVRANSSATTGNLVFFPQVSTAAVSGTISSTSYASLTADPMITSGLLAAAKYDLPDMSTPYSAGANGSAVTQADETTAALAVTSLSNQYVTDSGIAAVTDLLLSQPMRRYSAAVNYKANTITDANGNTLAVPFATNGTMVQAIYRGAWKQSSALTPTTINNTTYYTAQATTSGSTTTSAATNLSTAIGTGSKYYGPAYSNGSTTANVGNSAQAANLAFATTAADVRKLCLTSISYPANNTIFDREETTPAGSSSSSTPASFVVSPNTSTTTTVTTVGVCGEAAVMSINNGGTTGASALSATLGRSDASAKDLNAYINGWVYFNTATTANSNGLPIIGRSFIRAANGAVNYGFGYPHKVTR